MFIVPTSGDAARGDTARRCRVQGLEPIAGIGIGYGAERSQHQCASPGMTIDTDPGTGRAGFAFPNSALLGAGAILTSGGVTTIGGPNRSGISTRLRLADGFWAEAMPAAARDAARTHTALRSAIRRMRWLSGLLTHIIGIPRPIGLFGPPPVGRVAASRPSQAIEFPNLPTKRQPPGLRPAVGVALGVEGAYRVATRRLPSFSIHVNGRSVSTGLVEIFSPRMFSKIVP